MLFLLEERALHDADAANKSALVVNLDLEPEVIDTAVHIAEWCRPGSPAARRSEDL